jgi:thioredoxin-like negative regulator of GroEL
MADADPQQWRPRTVPVTANDLVQCPVLVLHYWAIWNLHDRTMDDLLLPFQQEYAGRVCFRSCDTDRAENRTFIHGIANIPALGCFIRGRWRKSIVGLRPVEQLRLSFDQLLDDRPSPLGK